MVTFPPNAAIVAQWTDNSTLAVLVMALSTMEYYLIHNGRSPQGDKKIRHGTALTPRIVLDAMKECQAVSPAVVPFSFVPS